MSGTRYPEPRIRPAGDCALLVELGDQIIDEALNRDVHALTKAIEDATLPGVVDLIPAYRSVLVCYDPIRADVADLPHAIVRLASTLDSTTTSPVRTIDIPTCYGGEFGPDLPFVAAHARLSPDAVVAIHAAGRYVVFMMGFSPGFSYLGGMSPLLETPRLKTPRTSIPAGSVGIAQQQTGIYPVDSPGGWQLIGRTPLALFDPDSHPPTLLRPGDVVRFSQIAEARYRELERSEGPRSDLSADLSAGAHSAKTDASIEVLEGGPFSTIQDLGRYGFERYGVPVCGAMDAFATRIGNLLVGNRPDCAVVEMTLGGAQLLFERDAVVAVTGADMPARVDQAAAPMWEPVFVAAGSVVSFRRPRTGARTYLAVQGGFDVPIVLGSRSTYVRSRFGGLNGRPLASGDRLAVASAPGATPRRMPPAWLPTYVGSHRLRVVLGPQESAFTGRGIRTFLSSAFTVNAQSDRMGYRLDGPRIEHQTSADIISDGTPPGAVQVAGDGLPLVLLADRGTTGGYAKIATIISADLPRIAQMQPGDRVFFDQVSVSEAHAIARKQEDLLAQIAGGPAADVQPASGTPTPVRRAASAPAAAPARAREVVSPLPGKVVEVRVTEGGSVERGQTVCVIEAMKMHNPVAAPRAGQVVSVKVAAGDQVQHGQPLMEIA